MKNSQIKYTTLAEKLVHIRTHTKESIGEVSLQTGIDSTTLSNFENGSNLNPTLNELKKLANHFKTTIAYLAGEEDIHFNSERYLWLKQYAKKIEWRAEDGTFRCNRPELDNHVSIAIKNTVAKSLNPLKHEGERSVFIFHSFAS